MTSPSFGQTHDLRSGYGTRPSQNVCPRRVHRQKATLTLTYQTGEVFRLVYLHDPHEDEDLLFVARAR